MSAAVKTINANHTDIKADYLQELETQLKELWSQYVRCLDENGFNDTARSLKERYFNIYRCYRDNKKWREVMSN